MRGLVDKFRVWSAPRWNVPETAAAFLTKPLPRNVSWLHTLGSLLLCLILFQALTGILMGFYYSASPDSAYQSVRYVRDHLFLGSFVYRLHRFGAAFVMVTAFLHAARGYFQGAYKPPRELLWITGLLLGGLLTLFAFTGQLLPFDQRGYWATVVGIRIASSAPVVGETIGKLLTGGYGHIGATTLSRFYILHVCVLPLALAGLVALHLGILQKVGSAPPARTPAEPYRPFFPGQAFKDVLISAGAALALVLVAVLVTTEDSGPANPVAGNFVPRPEWYFLAHYQILRVLPGQWQIVGTFLLPTALLMALLGLPFVDRGPDRSPTRRFVTVAGAVAFISIVGLTAQGTLSTPGTASDTQPSASTLTPAQRGLALLDAKKCRNCHTLDAKGGSKGPDLTHVARRLRADYLPGWIRNPQSLNPATEMPSFDGTEEELDALVEYLLTLK